MFRPNSRRRGFPVLSRRNIQKRAGAEAEPMRGCPAESCGNAVILESAGAYWSTRGIYGTYCNQKFLFLTIEFSANNGAVR